MITKYKSHKHSTICNLYVGQIVIVSIAHTYTKDYGWFDYSESNYIIEKISKKEIFGRSERYSHECIRISRENLDSGRFILRV
jgi:hypothetical protein